MHGEKFNKIYFIDFIMNMFILLIYYVSLQSVINTETVTRITDMKQHSGKPYNIGMWDIVCGLQSTFQVILTLTKQSSGNIIKETYNTNKHLKQLHM